MMRKLNFRPTMKALGLRKSNDSSENSIVNNFMSVYYSVGPTSCMKDSCATRRVMTTTLLSIQTKNNMNLTKMSESLKMSRLSLMRAKKMHQRVEVPNSNELWEFSDRLPWKDQKIAQDLRCIIQFFWKDNTRVSPNRRDFFRRRIGNEIHESHPKNFWIPHKPNFLLIF